MRTLIDIDDTLLEYAMKELGTKTKRDTVNEALRRAAGTRLRHAYLRWWEEHVDASPEEVARDRVEGWQR